MEDLNDKAEAGLGELPVDWSLKPLVSVGEVLNGLTYAPSDVSGHGTLVLRSSNIQNDTLSFRDNVLVEMDIPERILVKPNDVLICVRNGSRALIGKTALLDERVTGMTFGAFMAVFRSPYGCFINCLFRSSLMKRQIDQHLGATINQITNGSLKSFLVPMPSGEPEIRAIECALSDVDALLERLDQLIAKKRDLKQAAMQQLLTGQTRLPGFEGEWESKNLGALLRVRHGRDQKEIVKVGGRYPIWATGGEIGRTDTPLYDRPSVLIGRKGTIDAPRYVDKPFWTVDTLFYTEMVAGSSARFLYYLFCTIPWKSFNEASGVPSLNARTIEGIEVVVPLPEEQAAIADVLHEFDMEIEALEKRRAKTANLKQAMMQELLTGRTRLV